MRYSLSHLQYAANMSAFTAGSQKASPRDQIRGEIASRGLLSVENGDERPQSLTARDKLSYKYNIGNHFQSHRSF